MTNKSLLRSSIEWGADEAIGEQPRNYFAAPKIIETPSRQQPGSGTTKDLDSGQISKNSGRNDSAKIQASPALGHASARELADKATTLAELEVAVRGFDGCTLKRTAQKTVFADGNPEASLMIIGEAPGADEDVQGIPFCGVSGKLLDKMLAAIGLDRSNVYISNTVFWRPPGNRQPSVEEMSICLPFVERHIALVAPKLLLLAGGTATHALLGREESMSRLRGKTYPYQNNYLENAIPTLVTYHPSYLLRQPSQKRAAWQDMLMIQNLIS